METVEIVLNKMKELNAPVNATTIAKETGLDKKDVDKAMAQLKKRRENLLASALQVASKII